MAFLLDESVRFQMWQCHGHMTTGQRTRAGIRPGVAPIGRNTVPHDNSWNALSRTAIRRSMGMSAVE
jgi:hypothetical protein